MRSAVAVALAPATLAASTGQCIYNLKDGVCFAGTTLRTFKASSTDECCSACQDDSQCTHFTFSYNQNKCGLKTGTPVDKGQHDHCTSGVMRGPGSQCKHVHAVVNQRYDGAAHSFLVHAEKEPVCTLDGCGCRCRQGCETQHYTHWSLSREYDPTHKSWMCYCYAGTPSTLPKADHGWYSGVTRIAHVQNYSLPRDDVSDGVVDLVEDLADTAVACIDAEEDPVECAAKILDTIIDVIKEIVNAFTHSRTIDVSIPLPPGTSTLKHVGQFIGDTAGEGGTDMAFGQNDKALHMKFHNDGPLGGCQQFQHTNCNWVLIVCVSNPLIGHNKARVAYAPDFYPTGPSQENVWGAMQSWGEVHEHETVSLSGQWNHYDNPSTIQYNINVPPECRTSSIFEV